MKPTINEAPQKRKLHQFNLADVVLDEQLLLKELAHEEEDTLVLHQALGYYEPNQEEN